MTSGLNDCQQALELVARNETHAALTAIRRAVKLDPQISEWRYQESLILLRLGRLERGFELYEHRLRREIQNAPRAPFLTPPWLGKGDLRGRRLFVYPEQSFEDCILYLRYAKLAAERGAHVIAGVPDALKNLAPTIEGVGSIVLHGDPSPQFDAHCPLPSLPLAFGTTLRSIPAAPYITADPERVARFPLPAGRKIGLAWHGQPAHPNDRGRSIPYQMLEPILSIPDLAFVSLQSQSTGDPRLAEAASHAQCLADTVAIIDQLDLVIAVDTAVAHLAGAMGKPVWIMLPFRADFRWMEERTDSPWYPSATLFRQPSPDDWPVVVNRIAAQLKA